MHGQNHIKFTCILVRNGRLSYLDVKYDVWEVEDRW